MGARQELTHRIAVLKQALKAQPELFPWLAGGYLEQGKTGEAELLLNEGLTRFPNSVAGWLVRGDLFLQLDQRRKAGDAFEQALKLDPNLPHAHEQCAEIAEKESDSDRYHEHMLELSRLDALDDSVQSLLETMLLRQLAVEQGLYSKDEVVRVIPGLLRQTLEDHNLLPSDMERKGERPRMRPSAALIADEDLILQDSGEFILKEAGLTIEEPPEERALPGEDAYRTIESFKALNDREVRAVDEARGARGEEPPSTRVSWADSVTSDGRKPLLEVEPPLTPWSAIRDATLDGDLRDWPPSGELDQIPGITPLSGEADEETVSESSTETSEPRESPIMRLLRGEMQEKPVSREVKFPPDVMEGTPPVYLAPLPAFQSALDTIFPDETEPRESPAPEPPPVEMDAIEPELPATLEPELSAEPAVETAPEPEPSTEPTPALEMTIESAMDSMMEMESLEPEAPPSPPPSESKLIEPPSREEEIKRQLAEVAREVTGGNAQPKPTKPEEKPPQEKIATKTLAELYASQGDWARAVGVYEQLLKKHPANEAYKSRLKDLQKKIETGQKK